MDARLLFLGGLLGVCSAALSGDTRPLWAYHNGNTLSGYNIDYQNGFIVGVVDGYLAAHQRLIDTQDESPIWLDDCVSGGWPAPRLAAGVRAEVIRAYQDYQQPAAQTILQRLEKLCDGGVTEKRRYP